MPLAVSVERREASAAEIDAALARIDGAPGVYFGGDAGIAGLHRRDAILLDAPSLRFRVFVDRLEVDALDAFGHALLGHDAMAAWRQCIGRTDDPIAGLRRFLGVFAGRGADDAALAGAFGFDAHRLSAWTSAFPGRSATAPAELDGAPIGVLFFAPRTWQRDEAGDWYRIALRFEDASLAQPASAERPPAAPPLPPHQRESPLDADVGDDFRRGGYAVAVAAALPRLSGDRLVSLTLSQSFRRRLGSRSPARAFAALREANPAPATFLLDTGEGECLFGASPDLQASVVGRDVESLPVCGTVARGHGPVGEAEALRALFDEEVDAASLAVCTDALRNDLAPLCEPGSLHLLDRRRPMALATVVHAVDRLRGRLSDGADAWHAIVATAAPVMVTGTPRAAALEAIAACETSPRRWYGGLVVDVRASGRARVGTILRAASVRGGIVEVRTGGDLLADSDPMREELESRIKAVSLWRALGLPVDADLEAVVAGAVPSGRSPAVLPPTVAFVEGGDPFAAGIADMLGGFGLRIGAAGVPTVVAGHGDDILARTPGGLRRLVAIGDAAVRVLGRAGFAIESIAPRHGRLVECVPVAGAPGGRARRFTALCHSTLALAQGVDRSAMPEEGDDWRTWLRDPQGAPLILAHASDRVVCVLIRPESLLSDPLARDLLRDAIAFAAD